MSSFDCYLIIFNKVVKQMSSKNNFIQRETRRNPGYDQLSSICLKAGFSRHCYMTRLFCELDFSLVKIMLMLLFFLH